MAMMFSVRTERNTTREFETLDEAIRYGRGLIEDGWPTSIRRMDTGAVVMTEKDLLDTPPRTSDARAWDAWRRRSGYVGDHH